MKKLMILVLLITGFANAQVVNIPDVNFKNKLIQLGGQPVDLSGRYLLDRVELIISIGVIRIGTA